MLYIKAGVTPRLLIIAAAAANVGEDLTQDITITSGTDGHHMVGSKHYTGEALDIRLLGDSTQEFRRRLGQRLGQDYQVILETDHIHVEYDPAPHGTPAPLKA